MSTTIAPPAPIYAGPPYRSTAGSNRPFKRVVIHCTVGSDGKGAQGTARYFRSKEAKGSAHYVVDSDEVLQTAYDSVICWHAPPNQGSLGIELCCSLAGKGEGHWDRPDHQAMLRLSAQLTAQLCLAYEIPIARLSPADLLAGKHGICGHVDVSQAWDQSSHWDPGPYFPWAQFMTLVRDAARALRTTPPPATPEDDVTEQQADRIITLLEELTAQGRLAAVRLDSLTNRQFPELRADADRAADKIAGDD